MSAIADAVLSGDRRAVARLLTLVENSPLQARAALSALHPHTGNAHVIGITGAPGTGKSSLVNCLALELRRRKRTVGIIAVDPSSPFTGGAILGDRVRMQDAAGDKGVFIRSMATRGALGGITRATRDAIRVLDAFGRDVILVETVGVGQDEVDIARAAHTTIVVQTPALGDDIQALKAGILEIADILVINKADLPGVERVQASLEMMLELDSRSREWRPPILQTVATECSGISALVDSIDEHWRHLTSGDRLDASERQRTRDELLALLSVELTGRALAALPPGKLDDLVSRVCRRTLDPYAAVSALADAGARDGGQH